MKIEYYAVSCPDCRNYEDPADCASCGGSGKIPVPATNPAPVVTAFDWFMARIFLAACVAGMVYMLVRYFYRG